MAVPPTTRVGLNSKPPGAHLLMQEVGWVVPNSCAVATCDDDGVELTTRDAALSAQPVPTVAIWGRYVRLRCINTCVLNIDAPPSLEHHRC
jgi:hypothetical protein